MGVMLCPDYYLHKAIKNHYLCVLFRKVVVSYAHPSHTFTKFRSLKIHNFCEMRVPNTVEAYLSFFNSQGQIYFVGIVSGDDGLDARQSEVQLPDLIIMIPTLGLLRKESPKRLKQW
jgi:hypothetical protein